MEEANEQADLSSELDTYQEIVQDKNASILKSVSLRRKKTSYSCSVHQSYGETCNIIKPLNEVGPISANLLKKLWHHV